MAYHKEAVQNAEGDRRNSEKVHRCNGITMVPQECQPAFTHVWAPGDSLEPAGDRWLREIETKLQQLAVDSRCSPGRILSSHAEDKGSDLPAHRFAAAKSSSA